MPRTDPYGYTIGLQKIDFSTPLGAPIVNDLARRFRLEKVDPSAARSPVKKPIVFYIDRSAPEPVRTALKEGVSWWNAGVRGGRVRERFPGRRAARRRGPARRSLQRRQLGRPGDSWLVLRSADRRPADRRDHQGLGPPGLASDAPGLIIFQALVGAGLTRHGRSQRSDHRSAGPHSSAWRARGRPRARPRP